MAQDLIAAMAAVEPDSFEVAIEVALPDEVADHLRHAERLREQFRAAQSKAAEEVQTAARLLAKRGLSRRDIGAALGVSHQRAQ